MGSSKISRYSLHDLSTEDVIVDVYMPLALCINFRSRSLYWSDNATQTIEYSTLDGFLRSTVVKNEVAFQITIAGNYLLWTQGTPTFRFTSIADFNSTIQSVDVGSCGNYNLYGLVSLTTARNISAGMYYTLYGVC